MSATQRTHEVPKKYRVGAKKHYWSVPVLTLAIMSFGLSAMIAYTLTPISHSNVYDSEFLTKSVLALVSGLFLTFSFFLFRFDYKNPRLNFTVVKNTVVEDGRGYAEMVNGFGEKGLVAGYYYKIPSAT